MSAIVYVLLSTLFTSAGQIFWKLGFTGEGILNIWFLFGCMAYGGGALLMILALRKGELSLVYPILATSYIWVSIVSVRLFGDVLGSLRISGLVVIICGVVLLGFSSRVGKGGKSHAV